jgi:hypothetical protein
VNLFLRMVLGDRPTDEDTGPDRLQFIRVRGLAFDQIRGRFTPTKHV